MEIKKMVGEALLDAANFIEGKINHRKYRIGVTILGSEYGIENVLAGAKMASKDRNLEVVLIGPKNTAGLETYEVSTEEEAHKKMEELLDLKAIDACVTMHYNFPIGVTTIGRIISPAKGKEVFIASTTGTSSTDKTEAMLRNAVYGSIVAKSCGVIDPAVGILNIDGAKSVERELKKLVNSGYEISLGESERADGGVLLRGNDILTGAADVVVCDSLTGNILMKLMSSFASGGGYEAIGYGYGPGVSLDYNRSIFIVSRASGSMVIKNAIQYAAETVEGNFFKILEAERNKLKNIKFDEQCSKIKENNKSVAPTKEKKIEVAKEVVTYQISGLDVMDLDSAVEELMGKGIYAESGMGCTGPIILVNESKSEVARKILIEKEFIEK